MAIIAVLAWTFSPLIHAAQGNTGDITEYRTTTNGSGPHGITLGPDGNVWFTEYTAGKIGKITPEGVVTEYVVSTNAHPAGITVGPDGYLWFTTNNTHQVGRITPGGHMKRYEAGCQAVGITAGADDNLWYTCPQNNSIGRMTSAGESDTFLVGPHASPGSITTGADGNLWFSRGASIAKFDPDTLTQTEYEVSGNPQAMTKGPDGNIWFTLPVDAIGRITPSGKVTKFPVRESASHQWYGITTGPDGNLWFAKHGSNPGWIGRVSTKGSVIADYPSGQGSGPWQITAGADGNMWFTDAFRHGVSRVTIAKTAASNAPSGDESEPTPDASATSTEDEATSAGKGTSSKAIASATATPGATEEEAGASGTPAPFAGTVEAPDNDGVSLGWPLAATGVAALASAGGAAWYLRRRRS